jgi:L-ascorbate metabolism protein UlaG (beta-lactamase superfamily)
MSDGATLARRADPADRIVFLGHSTELIEVDGMRLLTDPLLRDRVAHLHRQVPPLQPAVYAGLDAVLISHLHHDHLDLASLRLLDLDIPLLAPAGAGELLRRKRFTCVSELSVGETTNVGALQVEAVEARHDGRRHPGGMHAETLGYVIRGRRTVYFAGDTELFDGMSALRSSLDVALLPVAGWGSTLGPGHMDPLDAARAVRLLQPRVAIPMHWGTLLPIGIARRHRDRLGDPPRQFAKHVASLAPGVEVRILEPGQGTML